MVRYGRWLLRRHRTHFVGAFELSLFALLIPAILVEVLVAALYLDLSRREAIVWTLCIAASAAAALRLGIWSCRRLTRVIRSWLRGATEDPRAAWDATIWFCHLGPRRTLLAGMLTLAPSLVLPPIAWGVDGPTVAWLVVAGVIASLIVNHSLGIAARDLHRPLLEELGRGLEMAEIPGIPRLGVTTLLGRTFLATAFLAGFLVPAMSAGTSVGPDDLGPVVIIGVVVGLVVAYDARSRVARPLVHPLYDLVAATQRVRRGDLGEPVLVTGNDELGDLGVAFNEMQRGLREREALHAAFGSYVDPTLAERLLDSGSSIFDGEELDVTVLFADVRDFTSFSEGVEPAQAVALLNRLFDVIVPVLHEYGGHANHYLGDGLLAVFGAPQPSDQHAAAAVAASIEIQRRVRDAFGDEVRLGIGINTGLVIAGTVGGGGRHEFTVIGDSVNAAARVEQLTKETGDAILITEATRTALPTPRPRSTKRGEFEVRGKATKLTLYAVHPFPQAARRSTR